MSENETTKTEEPRALAATPAAYDKLCECKPKRQLGVPHEPECGMEAFQLIDDGAAFIREMAATHLSSKDDGMRLQLAYAWYLRARAIAERLERVEAVAERRNAERTSREAPEPQKA